VVLTELKRLYAGWYISFTAVNASNYSRTRQKEERRALAARLREAHADFLDVEDYLSFGELVFYAHKVQRGDEALVIATDGETQIEYKAKSRYLRLPPLYYFLGTLFFEGKL
jgi:cellobiose phosphorylase